MYCTLAQSLTYQLYKKNIFRVPVEIPKPYPVYHTKEVKVEIEKPVFVKEPVHVKYPVPKPYYVEVPTPVKVSVPQQVVVKEPQVVSSVSHHNIGSTIGNNQSKNKQSTVKL